MSMRLPELVALVEAGEDAPARRGIGAVLAEWLRARGHDSEALADALHAVLWLCTCPDPEVGLAEAAHVAGAAADHFASRAASDWFTAARRRWPDAWSDVLRRCFWLVGAALRDDPTARVTARARLVLDGFALLLRDRCEADLRREAERLVAGALAAVARAVDRFNDPEDEELLVEGLEAWGADALIQRVRGETLVRLATEGARSWRKLPEGTLWIGAQLLQAAPRAREQLLLFARDRHGWVVRPRVFSVRGLGAALAHADEGLARAWEALDDARRDDDPHAIDDLIATYELWIQRWSTVIQEVVGCFFDDAVRDGVDLVIQATGPLVVAPWDLLMVRGRPLFTRARSLQVAPSRDLFVAMRERGGHDGDSRGGHDGDSPCVIGAEWFGAADRRGLLAARLRHLAAEHGASVRTAFGAEATRTWLLDAHEVGAHVVLAAHGEIDGVQLPDGPFPRAGDVVSARGVLLASCLAGRAIIGVGGGRQYGPGDVFGGLARLIAAGADGVLGFTALVPDVAAVEVCLRTLDLALHRRDEPFHLARARRELFIEAHAGPGTPESRLMRAALALTMVVSPS